MESRKILALTGGAVFLFGYGLYRWNYRMPIREFTGYALFMGVLDDAIARRELDGICIFPPQWQSIQYKYHLYLQLNRGKSRNMLLEEIRQMEERLKEKGNPVYDDTL